MYPSKTTIKNSHHTKLLNEKEPCILHVKAKQNFAIFTKCIINLENDILATI